MKRFKKSSAFLLAMFFGLVSSIGMGQTYQNNTTKKETEFKWPEGKQMGLSFSFDDARLTQVDKGIPLLDKYGVKATFYLVPGTMEKRLGGWKKAAENGHDIGNHSLTHPCTGNFDWSRDNALENYTLEGISRNLDSASKSIKKELGIQPVSFAYPCGQKYIGRGIETKSYVPVISGMFETGRGWLDEAPNDPSFCDMSQLTGMELDGKSFEQVKEMIESAKSTGKWLILAGHEMNDGGNQTSLLSTIEAICKYALDPSNGIWIDNVHNIASYVKEKRGEVPFAEMPLY